MGRRTRILISGIVQGVGFRPFLFNLLTQLGIAGTINNTGNLGVELELEIHDETLALNTLCDLIKAKAPPIAFIEDIQIAQPSPKSEAHFKDLTIIPSNEAIGKGLSLPPDIAMCDQCLEELRNPVLERYFEYPFISCAQCGPRFTITRSLPYDRPVSSMASFPFCTGYSSCTAEYLNPTDRRFHAQTFACKKCGPSYFNFPSKSKLPDTVTPASLTELTERIQKGNIVAIKGIGGVNLVCRADREDIVAELRKRKRNRDYKPFAVMMPSLSVAKRYCSVSPLAESMLTSFRRPIVLCPKIQDTLPPNISPGLAHTGIILPYMGLHYLLFDKLKEIPLIFTSGNLSSLPMAIDNKKIMEELADLADFFYLHNREIYQRCDDSVLRIVADKPTLIRRSRGYVPEYIRLPFTPSIKAILAFGPEENSTGAVAKGDRVFPTQHIGEVENLETFDFLDNAMTHMQKLLKIQPNEIGIIAHDLHPQFHSTKLALKSYHNLQEQGPNPNDTIKIAAIQHHHAHLASLMVEHKLSPQENIVAITLDGYGYGTDGQSWGGEILFGNYDGCLREAYLKPVPMVGGDLCTKYPGRMLLCNLYQANPTFDLIQDLKPLYQNLLDSHSFPNGEEEIRVLRSHLQKTNNLSRFTLTSGLGRLLDSASALLGSNYIRSYRGEPAMRFEGLAWGISPIINNNLGEYFKNNIILGDKLLYDYAIKVYSEDPQGTDLTLRRQLARNFHEDIAQLFADSAIRIANSKGTKLIGVSGGVAYNHLIVSSIKSKIEKAGLKFLQNERIPPGDAGISVGQIAIAAQKANTGELN